MARDRQQIRYERDVSKLRRDFESGEKSLRDLVEYCILDPGPYCGSLYVPTFAAWVGAPVKTIQGALAALRRSSGREIRPVRTYHRYGFEALDAHTVEILVSGQLRNVRIADHQYIDIDRTGLLVPIFRSSAYLMNFKNANAYQRAALATGFDPFDVGTIVELADQLEIDPIKARTIAENFLREISA